MHQHSSGLHHYNKRKRVHLKLEPFPHPVKWKRILDHSIYVVIITSLVLTIPQITEIWINKNTAGVSTISWGYYLISSIFWLVYGFAHQDRAIILSSVLWILFDAIIVVGTVVY